MRRFCILLTALLTAGCPAKKPAAPEATPSPAPAETPDANPSPTPEASPSATPKASPTIAPQPDQPVTTVPTLTVPIASSSPAAEENGTPAPSATPSPSPAPKVPPSPTATAPEPAKDAALEGTWSTTDADGEVFNLTLSRNGVAATDWTKGADGAKGQHGQWQKTGDTLVSIKYDDGSADAMMWLDGKWNLKRHPRAGSSFDPLAKPVPMQKVDPAKAKFIGTWKMNQEPDGSYLTITLYADGRAVSTVNGKTEGTWTVKGNAALCAWPDNWFDSIEPADKGWQRRSWVGAEANGEADKSEAARVGTEP